MRMWQSKLACWNLTNICSVSSLMSKRGSGDMLWSSCRNCRANVSPLRVNCDARGLGAGFDSCRFIRLGLGLGRLCLHLIHSSHEGSRVGQHIDSMLSISIIRSRHTSWCRCWCNTSIEVCATRAATSIASSSTNRSAASAGGSRVFGARVIVRIDRRI